MTRVSQIISVVGGVKADTQTQLEAIGAAVSQESLLSGLSKTYAPRFEDGAQLPPEYTRVQLTADTALDAAKATLSRLFDVTRTLDEGNALAKADVVVQGQVILPQVTALHLLFLERELGTLATLVGKIPILDQAEDWTDEGTEPGIHKTPPRQNARPAKVPFKFVKYDATPEHEAQVEILHRDEVVGYWTAVKFSGALDPKRKQRMLERIQQLRTACKFAREEANAAEVQDVRESDRIFGFVFAE